MDQANLWGWTIEAGQLNRIITMSEEEKNVIHDYSAIDRISEEWSNREEEVSKEFKSRNRMRYAKGGVQKAFETLLILVGLGLFAILVAFAIRLVIYQPLG
jgi:hypothetical protein